MIDICPGDGDCFSASAGENEVHRCDDVVFHYFLSTPADHMKGRDAHHMNCARGRRTNTINAVASMADVLLSGG